MAKVFNNDVIKAAQGEITFYRIPEIPGSAKLKKVAPEGNHVIVAHSETGHHHVLDKDKVELSVIDNASGVEELMMYLTVNEETDLTHLRDHDTHEAITFTPGNYVGIHAREHDPAQGWRASQD